MPFNRIVPSVGSYRRQSSLMNVVLPEPFSPTIAILFPMRNRMLTWRSAQLSERG